MTLRLTRVLASFSAASAVASGGFALAAWSLGAWRAAALGAGYIPMAPLTAASFMLLGLSLLGRSRWPDHPKLESASKAACLVVILVGAATLAQAWRPFPLPWDGWLLTSETRLGAVPLGQMSPLTAAAFLLSSISLLVRTRSAGAISFRWVGLASAGASMMIGLAVTISYAVGAPLLYGGATVPMALLTGLGFVGLNSGLLLAEVAGEMARDSSDLASSSGPAPGKNRPFVATAALFAVAVVAMGASLVFFRGRQEAARRAIHVELDTIAKLKADEVRAWREERLREARFLLEASAVATDVADLVRRPRDLGAQLRVRGWLEGIRGGDQYRALFVVGPAGRLLLALPESAKASFRSDATPLADLLAGQDVEVGRLGRRGQGDAIQMDLLVPIRAPTRPTRGARTPAVAVLVLRINPEDFLFPLVRRWPVRSATAESLLVRTEGPNVIYLNALRKEPASVFTPSQWLRAFMATAEHEAHGSTGVYEGLDDRGVLVLATLQPVKGSPWALVAKVDQAEAYEGIRREMWETGALVALILLTVMLSGVALAAERAHEATAERLALVMRQANDVILLLDPDLHIVDANERVNTIYGRSPEEMKTLTAKDLRAPGVAAAAPADFLSALDRSALFATTHRRRDGTTFPVEVSARRLELEGRPYILSVVRDVTERLAHEREVERLNRLYASLSHVNQAILHAASLESFLQEVCQALAEHGPFSMAWVGRRNPVSGVVEPLARSGDVSNYLGSVRITTDHGPDSQGPTGIAIREGRHRVVNDILNDPTMRPWQAAARRAGFGATMALPVRIDSATPGSLTVYAREAGYFGAREIALLEEAALDISFGLENLEREAVKEKAEERTRESEERLRLALSAAQQGLYDLNIRTGAIVVSPEYALLLGYDPATFRETNPAWLERLHPEDRDRVDSFYRDYMAGLLLEYRVEFRMRTRGGDWKWILSLGRIVQRESDGSPLRMLGTYTDITERKLAEEALRDALLEQKALLKEVHHRVKNNLQVITSLLRLEGSRNREQATRLVLQDMQSRILSMALLHETLYRTGNFARVDLSEYLKQLATQLFRGQNADPGRIQLELSLTPTQVDLDHAIPCGLLVNELLTNSLKHGFTDGRSGVVCVALSVLLDGAVQLSVGDNGAGLPPDFETRRTGSLGLQLVSDLARQLGGALETGPGPGATFVVRFHPERRRSGDIARPPA